MDGATYVFVIAVILLGVLLAWDRIVRPALEDWGVLRVEEDPAPSVSNVSPPPPAHYVKSPAPLSADTATDPGLSAGLSALSEAQEAALEAITLDRTQDSIVYLLVAFGWKTGEIRSQLKGDTGKIGERVRAARLAQGLEDEEVPRTPLAGRPIPAGVVFQED